MRAGALDARPPGGEQGRIDFNPFGLQQRPTAGEEQVGAGEPPGGVERQLDDGVQSSASGA
jgi:hypothetical protein